MLGNNVMPSAYENLPAANTANTANAANAENAAKVSNAAEAAEVQTISCDDFNMCKLQYYNPPPIIGARLAHAYVPFQCLCCLYPPMLGLKQGTIFPELDRPYGADPAYSYDG